MLFATVQVARSEYIQLMLSSVDDEFECRSLDHSTPAGPSSANLEQGGCLDPLVQKYRRLVLLEGLAMLQVQYGRFVGDVARIIHSFLYVENVYLL